MDEPAFPHVAEVGHEDLLEGVGVEVQVELLVEHGVVGEAGEGGVPVGGVVGVEGEGGILL